MHSKYAEKDFTFNFIHQAHWIFVSFSSTKTKFMRLLIWLYFQLQLWLCDNNMMHLQVKHFFPIYSLTCTSLLIHPYSKQCFAFGPIYSHLVPFSPIWSHLVPFGSFWSHLVPFGPIWSHSDQFGFAIFSVTSLTHVRS